MNSLVASYKQRSLRLFIFTLLLLSLSSCSLFGSKYDVHSEDGAIATLGARVDAWQQNQTTANTVQDSVAESGAQLDENDPRLSGAKSKSNQALNGAEVAEVYRRAYSLLDDPIAKNNILQRLAALDLKTAENLEVAGLVPESQEAYQVAILAYTELLQRDSRIEADSSTKAGDDKALNRDELLYGLAKAYALVGDREQAFATLSQLVETHPGSEFWFEAQFRRGEHLFIENEFKDAERVFTVLLSKGAEVLALQTENARTVVTQEFLMNARYMAGWSQFKRSDYAAATATFVTLLDEKTSDDTIAGSLRSAEPLLVSPFVLGTEAFAQSDKLVDDALRAITLSLTYAPLNESILDMDRYLSTKPYAHWVYAKMAMQFFLQERLADAAKVYGEYAASHAGSEFAPWFANQKIAVLQHAGFSDLAWQEKAAFADTYHPTVNFYLATSDRVYIKNYLDQRLGIYIDELSSFHHARARQLSKNSNQLSGNNLSDEALSAFDQASHWYRQKISAFPEHPSLGNTFFLLGDSLQESGRLVEAIESYELAAYGGYGFDIADSLYAEGDSGDALGTDYEVDTTADEAGYAAILTYDQHIAALTAQERSGSGVQTQVVDDLSSAHAWRTKKIESALLFADSFVDDERITQILANTIDDLRMQADWPRLIEVADRLLGIESDLLAPTISIPAWLTSAAAAYQLEAYIDAERRYAAALDSMRRQDYPIEQQSEVDRLRAKELQASIDNYASSIYKQAEIANVDGDQNRAIAQFERLVLLAPTSKLRVDAERNAIVLQSELQQWLAVREAVPRFLESFPGHPDTLDMNRRLLNATVELKDWRSASVQASALSAALVSNSNFSPGSNNSAVEQAALQEEANTLRFAAAEYALEAGDTNLAITRYKDIIKNSRDVDEALYESHNQLANLFVKSNNRSAELEQYRIIRQLEPINADRSDRAKYIVANAEVQLAEIAFQNYRGMRIEEPLVETLNRKREALERTIAAYDRTEQYAVRQFALRATERKALIYADFAKAIMESDRPQGLDELALEEYEFLLEEQAYPFEEQAIELYEVNIKRAWQGMSSEAISESYSALAELLPARYDKPEIVN